MSRFIIDCMVREDGEWVQYSRPFASADAAHKERDHLREKYPECDWRVREADQTEARR